MFQCLFCENHKFSLIKHGTRDSEQNVVKCNKCGLVQLDPIPTVEEDAMYYNKNMHDKVTTPMLDIEGIYDKFLYQNINKCEYLKKKIHISKDWKMLDYASGYGFFIELMYENGYIFDGVEIGSERLKISQERLSKVGYKGKIFSFNLQETDLPNEMIERYDLITMYHLLEHLTNPVETLRKIKKILKPNGILVLELPNYDNSMMKISKEFHDFFFIREHVAYYTPNNIKLLMEKVGLKILFMEGVQVYGLENHMNWIINKKPQLINPSYESCTGMKWIEDIYRKKLEEELKSEYMCIIVTNNSD